MTEEPEPLTVDMLKQFTDELVKRTMIVNGKKCSVKFRKLTYGQILALESIPRDQVGRYVKNVIFTSSVEPKFEKTEDLDDLAYAGFIKHYSDLILSVSSENPFLGQE